MIRKAVKSDEAAIRACAEKAYGRYVAAIGRKPAPMVADFASQIAASQVYLATDDGDNVQGFIVFFPREDHMFLENIAVQPAATGRGIGKSLIAFCEDEARRLSLGTVHLYTNEKMTDNLSMYPYLGYREVERRTEDGFKRVFFEKHLGCSDGPPR
ncbi:GNAT family N-acetyltransferase [Microvirga sp. c23x22]|uniref:GNAT family N-acetyltransferase n=2 Tax=Microvirga terricola TaxID=2719797 RepID=A0ABX0VBB0_9HYPH|nr:GNAT family N-acetyltransferase [Microvirga terricola]